VVVAYAVADCAVDRVAHGLVDRNNEPIGSDFSNVYAGTLALAGQPHVAYGRRHLRAGTKDFYAGPATQMRRGQEGKSGKNQTNVTILAASVK
jgi:hypothetical protein